MKITELFMVVLTAVLLASCGGDDDKDFTGDFGQIKVPDTRQLVQDVSADDTQAARGVTFTTEAAWTSTVTQTRSDAPDWIAVSPDHGDAAGTYTLTITLQTNPYTESRSATIVIRCGTSKIEIVVTQEGTDNPAEQLPANRIVRIENRYQRIPNSGTPEPERWIATSHFAYDDAGRTVVYRWDDTPQNTTDPMDEEMLIRYPDGKTLKLEITKGETGSYTVTLDAAGRAVAARNDNGPERWTFAYDNDGYCSECTYGGDTDHYYPRTTCRWTNGDLTGLDIYREQGIDFSYAFRFHDHLPNTRLLYSLDLNALLFDVCPDIEDSDVFMGSLLSGIGHLGNRSAHLTNTNPNEHAFLRWEEGGAYLTYRIKDDRIEWEQRADGRVIEANWILEVECVREEMQTGAITVLPDRGYTEKEMYRIFYSE